MQPIRVAGINRPMRFFLIIFFLLFSVSLFPAEQISQTDIQRWFKENKNANRYAVYREKIETIFLLTEKAELPLWILWDKLNEGAAKRVKGETLSAALEREYNQLSDIRDLLNELKILLVKPMPYEECLKTLSLYLSGGLGLELLRALLIDSHSYLSDPAILLPLCEAVLKIRQTVSLDDTQLRRLAADLAGSTLQPDAYLSVSSLFVKGKIKHIQDETLFTLVTETLSRGGGLIQLNDELNRRMKK